MRGTTSYFVALRVNSFQFVDTFRKRFAEVLARNYVAIQGPKKDGCLVVRYGCARFVRWWRDVGVPGVSKIARAFPRDYLEGRFDSESSVGNYVVYMCGAEDHRAILEFDRELCARLGMRTGRIEPYGATGLPTWIRGRLANSKAQRLRLSVNASDFLSIIGTINVETRIKKLRAMIKGRRWTPWEERPRILALELQRGGLNPREVCNRLSADCGYSVPYTTVYFWLRRGIKTWEAYSLERKLSQVRIKINTNAKERTAGPVA